jgi:YidC/Oxa1 family membrane protein insertase
LGFLQDALSQFIQFLYTLTASIGIPNYGIAIILFTIAIKLILLPLTSTQVRSMRAMQEIQPKVQEIQKKYKNDPQKSQQAMMELYQKHKVNPFSGCLPLLVQMPILYSLFAALRNFFSPDNHPAYVNMEHARFLWIPNLGEPDLYVLPILAVIFTFLQQKLSAPSGNVDQTQKTMLYFMPLFMGWISRSFPAGLALYWIVYSIVSGLEQLFLRKRSLNIKEEASAK